MRHTTFSFAAVIALVLSTGLTVIAELTDSPQRRAPAASWPCFRGSLAMTGDAGTEFSLPPDLLWSFNTGDSIEATAAIADGVVYIPTMDGRCYALDLNSGKELWKFVNPDMDGAKSSPCIAGDLVCYGDDFGVFRALDRKTGEQRWKIETEGEIISSATHIKGVILFGSYDTALYCVDAQNGKEVWKLQTDGPVHCSPSLVDDQVAVAGCDGVLRLVNVFNGKETRSLEIGGNIASTPAVGKDLLFVGTMNAQVLGIDFKDMTRKWTYQHPTRSFEYYSSAALAEDTVIIGGRDKMVHCLDRKSGTERWAFRTKARVDSSPVVLGKSVYFGSSDGSVYAVGLDQGKKQWDYVTGGAIVASPAMASGCLVIANTDGIVFCFGKKK